MILRSLCSTRVTVQAQVIELCEKLSSSNAKVTTVPTGLLKLARSVLRSFQWARDASDRLVSQSQQKGVAVCCLSLD